MKITSTERSESAVRRVAFMNHVVLILKLTTCNRQLCEIASTEQSPLAFGQFPDRKEAPSRIAYCSVAHRQLISKRTFHLPPLRGRRLLPGSSRQ